MNNKSYFKLDKLDNAECFIKPKENETALTMDILKYIHIAIEDKNIDCDKLIAIIMAVLEDEQKMNLDRVMYYYSRIFDHIARR